MSHRDPLHQLSDLRLNMDAGVRARHLDAIETELRHYPATGPSRRRRWTLGVVVATLLAGPVTAVASDQAVPGDLLYPIKRAVEPIVRLFDEDVVAQHRVEEVGQLVDREFEDAVIIERIAVARDAIEETGAEPLQRELDRIVDRWAEARSGSDSPVRDVPVPTTAVRDVPVPTTAVRDLPVPTTPVRDAPRSDPADSGDVPEPTDTQRTTASTAATDDPVDTPRPPDVTTSTSITPHDGDGRPAPDDGQTDAP